MSFDKLSKWRATQPDKGSAEEAELNRELREKSLKTTTFSQYKTPISYFEIVSSFPATGEGIQAFNRAMVDINTCCFDTVNQYTSAIRTTNINRGYGALSQTEEAQIHRCLQAAELILPKAPKKRAAIISDEVLLKLVITPVSFGSKYYQLRGIALLSMGLCLRLGESVKIRGRDIDINVQLDSIVVTVKLFDTKTRKLEEVHTACKHTLYCNEDWCSTHFLVMVKEKCPGIIKIFPDLSQKNIISDIERWMRHEWPSFDSASGLKGVTGHSFRRTAASRALKDGASVDEVKAFGRWNGSSWEDYVSEVLGESTLDKSHRVLNMKRKRVD